MNLDIFKGKLDSLDQEAKEAFLKLLEDERKGREDITYFSEHSLGIPLNSFQKRYLGATTTPRAILMERLGKTDDYIEGMLFGKNVVACSNQLGKTVAIAIKHIWFAKYKIGMQLDENLIDTAYYATLNISPHTRQVRAAYRYIKDILHGEFIIDEEGKKRLNELSPTMKGFLVGDNSSLGELRYANGSITYSVPVGQDQASSLAGAQFALITYDECAQSHHLKDELGAKIMSRLIKYGVCLDLVSTPEVDAPSHQQYLHIFREGQAYRNGWQAFTGKLDENTFIPSKQRERIKNDLKQTDPKRYAQVVAGEFISGGKRFFDSNEIDNIWITSGKTNIRPGRKYLLVSDWGMADSGDSSVHGVFDYTDYARDPTDLKNKIFLVNHEEMQGGSPQMQFALLRTLYEQYTAYGDDGVTIIPPIFLMDANSLGGVVIKKLLAQLKPIAFTIEKDVALFQAKRVLSMGREPLESFEGIIEKNPNFGQFKSYFIDKLNDQLGLYHIEDKRLKTDFVMMVVMGLSYIVKRFGATTKKVTTIDPLAGYNAQITKLVPTRHNVSLR